MTDRVLRARDLIAIREGLKLTQAKMAAEMGMSLRAYQAIEGEESPYRLVHRLAAERIALARAVAEKDIAIAPAAVRADAIELSRLILGGAS